MAEQTSISIFKIGMDSSELRKATKQTLELGKVVKTMPKGLATIVQGTEMLRTAIVETRMEMEQNAAKFDHLFGGYAQAMDAHAQAHQASWGRNAEDIKSYMATFQNFLLPLLDTDQAAA